MELVSYLPDEAKKVRPGDRQGPDKCRVRIRHNSWIAKIACKCIKQTDVALTLFRTIYLSHSTPGVFLNNHRWVAHELAHVRQFRKYGNLNFVFMYLRESLLKGYYHNKWEVEARAEEEKPEILEEYYFEYAG